MLKNKKISSDGLINLDKTITSHDFHFPSMMQWLIILLFFLGLLAQYNAGGFHFLVMHIIKWSMALLVAYFISLFHCQQLVSWAYVLWFMVLLALIYVWALGLLAKGSQRWIGLGIFSIEPSEFCKIIVPLCVVRIIGNKPNWSFLLVLKCLLAVLPVIFLIIKQPDLGTAVMVFILSFTAMFAGGLPWAYIVVPFCTCLVFSPYLYLSLHEYQKQRIFNLFDPENDPLGSGYHILQSIIAVGSGGFFGKGIGMSTQANLEYLPEYSTDFIFALWSEEFGFIGDFLLIFLYFTISWWLISQSQIVKNRYSSVLLQVISVQLFFSAFVNISMVLGLLPVVGVPLPVLSFGGSSALTNGISLGVAVSCLRRVYIEKSFTEV